jgi:hypothetical protein
MDTDFQPVCAAPIRRNVLRGGGPAVERRCYARRISLQAALWAGRIAEHLGEGPDAVRRLRRIARAQAFARWSNAPAPSWAQIPAHAGAAIDVALAFTERLSPLEGEPELPMALLRELRDSPHVPVCKAAEALAAYFGMAVRPELLPTVEWARFENVRRDLEQMMTKRRLRSVG